jgi:hypothetical protein
VAVLVWITLGLAIWHFTIFVPDRFWGGIVGAFIGALIGANVSGAIWQVAQGASLGDTDLLTAAAAVPGCLIGLMVIYALGLDEDEDEGIGAAETP